MSKTEILKAAVLENLSKPIEERMTGKRLGELHGVSGARISQIASGLKVKPESMTAPANDPLVEKMRGNMLMQQECDAPEAA